MKIYKLVVIYLLLTCISTISSAQETFKILSYNVLYGLQKDSTANIERYIELVKALDPDIVATQEMNGWTQKSLEELAERYNHPYALQSKETGFPAALTSKTPPVNFEKVTENMWHSYLYAKVRGIHIFVIHFSPFSYQKRLEEIDNIIAQTGEISDDEPILIMGDFNSLAVSDQAHYGEELLTTMRAQEKKHEHIRNLNNDQIDYSVLNKLRDAGFKDSYRLQNNNFESSVPSYKSGNAKIKNSNAGIGKRIDFLWCNDTAAEMVSKSEIIKNEKTHIISDHYPVYVELILP
ncbi:MAG: endonuclease/exonuclease/phosphatase family protein [Sphingobacterium sp.]